MVKGHLVQPAGSRTCGQHCVAMLTGETVERARQACGRGGATSEHDLRRGLAELGLRLGTFHKRRQPWPCPEFSQTTALCRVRQAGRPGGYHWVVMDKDSVNDPALAGAVSRDFYADYLRRAAGYVTSWAPVVGRL